MEYVLVVSDSDSEFARVVNKYLLDGWELWGGVAISVSESEQYRFPYYAQALIKKESKSS